MMNSIKKVLGFMLAIALIVGMIPTFASNVYAEEGKWIYVDGVNGSDSNDGSEGSPVKSWEKAKNLLGCENGGIYVVGTVEASGEISTKNPAVQTVKRTSNIVMFNVSGEVKFANIDVTGGAFDSPLIKPSSGSTLNFLSGAVFHDTGYFEGAAANELNSGHSMGIPDNLTGGCVVQLENNITILVDGAEFRNNAGKGIFFAPMINGTSGKRDVNVYMKSGRVLNNQGFFYYNEMQGAPNNIYIYNALIRNNNASNMGARYSSYNNRVGAVYVCDMGQILLRSLEGAAIFDNDQHDIIYIESAQGKNVEGKESAMLGGGTPNWQHDIVDDSRDIPQDDQVIHVEMHYDVLDANPSQAAKDAAVAMATSVFEGNQSIVIDSNGKVYFGKENGESVPTTPNVPIIQGCDDTPIPEEPKEFEVEISKVEVNGTEELPGAELKIESSDVEGFETISWTSGTETKKITLKPGTYTMTETQAPENYEIAESITFVVSEDGKVTIGGSEVSLVRMEDARKEEPKDEEENPEEEPKDEEPKDEEPKEEEPKAEEPKNEEPPVEEPKEEKPEELPPPNVPSTGNPENPANNTPAPSNNTPPPTNNTPGVPVTGDSNNIMLWVVLGAVASIIAVTTMGLRRR